MAQQQEKLDWKAIQRQAGPYPIEAFNFVREGLHYTAQHTHENVDELPEVDRHISGQQLCLGLRDYAIEQYGLLAPTVLSHWHIRRTEDFGRIVFAMIDAGLMTKTDEDSLDDFRGVFDFGEAFNDDDLIGRIGS
ncbi:MAG: Minf_1886 family protein [Planctomycetota bacterium]|jgi:uncharacterized repeat protein (TIGR04138 family)